MYILINYLLIAALCLHCFEGYTLVAVQELLTAMASLVWNMGSRARGLSSFSSLALEHRPSGCARA